MNEPLRRRARLTVLGLASAVVLAAVLVGVSLLRRPSAAPVAEQPPPSGTSPAPRPTSTPGTERGEDSLAELDRAPPGDASAFLAGRSQRRQLGETRPDMVEPVARAERAWMERSEESAFAQARGLLEQQRPQEATATLCRLVHTLEVVGALESTDDQVRRLGRRAVVACLEAAGQEVKPLLAKKQYEEAAGVARRLAEELDSPARAVGLERALRDFQESHEYLAELARRARQPAE